ncbi:glycerophosphodiester phosphodiesterase [Clostridium sp. 19966]|uniref:glycerophosphodiester phosphodiesterase n=1 Tax=Clostridium sp. 19966 TaxID=2768166 RepID=UPI0028DEDC25|nr:glycerophosphodiester phosphodiesterase [Clostridium sp. 19966]MDT8716170.1 glycerophosphodiester phosphodiesterase [Clostridium sp. 19966]
MTLNYAHRGASGYCPENTMSAFIKAIELGCDAIETDVQMTSDGELVLIHDETVNRTTNGTGYVKDYDFSSLSKLDAGSWFNSAFHSERIPTAEELIILAKKNNILINFEIKNNDVKYPGIEEKLINLIKKHAMEHNVILSGFDHYSMVYCKKICKNIRTALLYSDTLYKPSEYCRYVCADAIHPYFKHIDKKIISEAHKKNILVNVYTVNEISDIERLISWGVDGIITNYPDRGTVHKNQ